MGGLDDKSIERKHNISYGLAIRKLKNVLYRSNLDTTESARTKRSASKEKQLGKRGGCDTCRKILSAIQDHGKDHFSVSLGKVHELLSSRCPRHCAVVEQAWVKFQQQLDHPDQSSQHDYEIMVWRSCFSTSISLNFKQNDEFCATKSPLPLLEVVRNASPSGKHGQGLLLDRSWINIDRLSEWYSDCKSSHGDHCASPLYLAQSPYPTLRFLIDTANKCLVSAPPKCSYIALSYVWGQVECLKATSANLAVLCESHSLNQATVKGKIPKTIMDAMYVVESLGERYLWTDAICIVQDDEDMMREQLNSMASIYAHASLVIVAATGSDAGHGLPGIQGVPNAVPRCLEQKTILFGDALLLQRNFSECNERSGRQEEYWKRGWTFQEYMFARRRIVFEKDSVCFECCTFTQYEDINTSTENPVWDPGEFRTLLEVGYPSLTMFMHIVNRFNQKDLTYPEDCLSAFAGSLSTFAKAFKGGSLCGLPELFFDVVLLWQPAHDLKRRVPLRNEYRRGKTASSLPSWSWAGWQGGLDGWSWATGCDFIATCSGLIAVTKRETIPITTWYTAATPDASKAGRRPINAEWSHWRDKYKTNRGELPPGWRAHRRILKRSLTNEHAPRGHGDFLYTHPYAQHQARFWYPVPICDPDPQPKINPDTPYLFSRIQSAWLYTSGEVLPCRRRITFVPDPPDPAPSISLRDHLGVWAGVLRLHCRQDIEDLLKQSNSVPTRTQLVAISRGSIPNNAEYPDDYLEEYEFDERPKDSDVYEYYDVIWIVWEDGVAYRKALGRVTKKMWEAQDVETIDLVLG
ncbi:HET-domain-containing protein [Rhizodiscina lignyota]|uniref:HET-domain-containing protein n=1 Tax=Rhizodiscina lignyota TaxID=1504668 RepID=A0A9P4IFU2_9PEZI|nr:HET-domain-containing protein [Rhizodiscina lignyota]